MKTPPRPTRVAIIGAGPAGATTERVKPVAGASGLPYRSASRLLPLGGKTCAAHTRSGAGASGTHAIRQAKTPALRGLRLRSVRVSATAPLPMNLLHF